MSNTETTEIAVKKSTGVVSVAEMQARLAEMMAASAGKTAPVTGNRIRITQDKQFATPDGVKTPGPIEVVIVDYTSRNEFYEGAFDRNNISPPACFAIGDFPLRLVPSNNSPVKQAESCNDCPNNAWGSSPTGGKACKNSRLLAVLPVDATEHTPIWLIQTSPTAIKPLDAHVREVQRGYSMPLIGVVTSIGFDPTQTYATLTFSDAGVNENLAVHMARLEEAKELLAQEPDVSGFNTAPAKKVAAPMRRTAVARR